MTLALEPGWPGTGLKYTNGETSFTACTVTQDFLPVESMKTPVVLSTLDDDLFKDDEKEDDPEGTAAATTSWMASGNALLLDAVCTLPIAAGDLQSF
jgi:hypothetical protein